MNHNKNDNSNSIFGEINIPESVSRQDSIELLGLPIRLENSLKNVNIYTLGDFYDYSKGDLLKIRNIGPKSIDFLSYIQEVLTTSLSENSEENHTPEEDTTELILSRASISMQDGIEILNLPVRIENALKNEEIKTVAELFIYPDDKFGKLWFMGPKSAALLIDIKNSIKKGVTPGSNEIISAPNIPEDKLIEATLDRCTDERSKDVITRRYGLVTGERETLEEIGQIYGVTRERIRQIETRSLKKMRHSNTRSKVPLTQLVENIFSENGYIISSDEADKLIPKVIKNCPFDGSSLLDLISDLGWIQRHKVGDINFYSAKLGEVKLSDLMEKIVLILKKDGGLLDTESIIRRLPFDEKVERAVLHSIVLKFCGIDPRIEEKISNKFTLYSNHGRSKVWVSLITQVLEEEGAPLHFTEIANRFHDLFKSEVQLIDHRRVYAILVENRVFAHTGIRGTYGLTKWGLRKESTADLALECIKKAGFPLHFKQIYNYICKYKDSRQASIKQILESSGKFEKMGKAIYGIKT